MYVTRWIDYGIRIVVELALAKGETMTGARLAGVSNVSRDTALRLVRSLVQAGLVETQRGRNGGIRLAREPVDITLLDIARACDRPRGINLCLMNPKCCERQPTCAVHRLLQPIQEQLEHSFSSISISDVVLEHRKIASSTT